MGRQRRTNSTAATGGLRRRPARAARTRLAHASVAPLAIRGAATRRAARWWLLLAAGTVALVVAFVSGAGAYTPPNDTNYEQFFETGSVQKFVVPAGITKITIDAIGAAGGAVPSPTNPYGISGLGGQVTATLPVTPEQTLYVYVGGLGEEALGGSGAGYNGGGGAISGSGASGGGGESDVCTASSCTQANALMVAGGGGGQASGGQSGGTGGETGGNGTASGGGGGGGATQSQPGAAGTLGTLGVGSHTAATAGSALHGGTGAQVTTGGGGGGGGWYGGGGGGSSTNGSGGGGGGSSDVAAGATSVSYASGVGDSDSSVPDDGNGEVTISWCCTTTTFASPTDNNGDSLQGTNVQAGTQIFDGATVAPGAVEDPNAYQFNPSTAVPTGQVAFTLCGPGATSCSAGQGTPEGDNDPVDNFGDYDSNTVTLNANGTYCFSATYGGDTTFLGSSDDTATDQCFTIVGGSSKTTPTVTERPGNGGSITYGSSIQVSASVTGSGATPTGSVTFTRCGPLGSASGCSGGTPVGSAVTLSGGSATSAGFTPSASGIYCFAAAYTPDSASSGAYNSASDTSNDGCFTVAKKTVHVDANAASKALGAADPTPTGTLRASDFVNGDTASVASGSPSCSIAGHSQSAGVYTGVITCGPGTLTAANYTFTSGSAADLTIDQATPVVSTGLDDAATSGLWSGQETTGASAFATAMVAGVAGIAPSGSVTYSFYASGGCSGVPLLSDTESLAGGLAGNSVSTPALAAGGYSYEAVYSGDVSYTPASGSCGSFEVQRASASVAVTVDDGATGLPWSGSETGGASAYAVAAVTGVGGFAPAGRVEYELFDSGSCSGSPASSETVSLGLASSLSASLSPGTYSYSAAYLGDSNYVPTSVCGSFTVKATPSVTSTVEDGLLGSPWGGETVGARAEDAAVVSGLPGLPVPTGTVTYMLFAGDCTTGTLIALPQNVVLNLAGDVPVSDVTSALAAGGYAYRAIYSGDSSYVAQTGPCETFTVGQGVVSLSSVVEDASSGSPWAGTEQTGAEAYDTSSVTGVPGFAPTGTVSYALYSDGGCTGAPVHTDTGLVLGVASSTTPALAAGAYSYRASYGGDSNYLGVMGCESFTVAQATPVVSTGLDDAATSGLWSGQETTGASAFATAMVAGVAGIAPSGSVTYSFYASGGCSGVPLLSDTESLAGGLAGNSVSTPALAAGGYSYEAVYSGDVSYTPASGSCGSFEVQRASASVAVTVDDGATGLPWSGSETGGASAYAVAAVTGVGGFAPAGRVEYELFDSGSCSGSPASSETVSLGLASSLSASLSPGTYSYSAAYLGDSNYVPTSVCGSFTVKATPSVTSTVEDGLLGSPWGGETVGASAEDAAVVSGLPGLPVPTGTVTYMLFAGDCTTGTLIALPQNVVLNLAGDVPVSDVTSALAAGGYAYRAIYSGDSSYVAQTGPCETFTVGQGVVSLSSVVEDASSGSPWAGTEQTGAEAYDTSSVTGVPGFAPTGTVSYALYSDGGCTGAPVHTDTGLVLGVASSTTPALAAGAYSYRASYGGDSNYLGVMGCESFTVAQATPVVSTGLDDAATSGLWSGQETTGASAFATAMVAGVAGIAPSGSVTYSFYASGGCSGVPLLSDTESLAGGLAGNSVSTPALAAGGYSYEAVYSGDASYTPATGSCGGFTVGPGTVTVVSTVFDAGSGRSWSGTETTGAEAYDTSSLTATAGFAPTGTISYAFYSNDNCTGNATETDTGRALGADSSTTAPLAVGSYSYLAGYSGDSNYTAATGTCESFTVTKATPTVSSAVEDAATSLPWSGSEASGASATDSATVAGVAGFVPSGSLSYSFYTNGSCAGPAATNDQVLLARDGTVPASAATGVLVAGSYSYQAAYSGDSEYAAQAGSCERFSVAVATASLASKVLDVATGKGWSGSELTGAVAQDSATLSSSAGIVPTGTVTYSLYRDAGCQGAPAGSEQVPVAGDGSVPVSGASGALAGGSYSYQAVYSGDSSYGAQTGGCEAFTVGKATPVVASAVDDAANGQGWAGTEIAGASAVDTATVTGVAGFVPSGTLTYSLYGDAGCQGTPLASGQVTLGSGGSVPGSAASGPLAAGSYSYAAAYAGDGNYTAVTSGCAAFTVAAAPAVAGVTGPAITLTSPSNGARYQLHQRIAASYSCQSAAGVNSCSGPVADGAAVDTATVGAHTFTVTAVAADGRQTTDTVHYTVSVSSHFTVFDIRVRRSGIARFKVEVGAAGLIHVLETAWDDNLASAASSGQLPQPAPGRFTFARASRHTGGPTTVTIVVRPGARGSQLVDHHRYTVRIRLWVTFQPTGGPRNKHGFYGLLVIH